MSLHLLSTNCSTSLSNSSIYGMKWTRTDRLLTIGPGLISRRRTVTCGKGGSDVDKCGAGPPGFLLPSFICTRGVLGISSIMDAHEHRKAFHLKTSSVALPSLSGSPHSREDPATSQSSQGGTNAKPKKNRTLTAFACPSSCTQVR